MMTCPDCNGAGAVPALGDDEEDDGYAPCPTCARTLKAKLRRLSAWLTYWMRVAKSLATDKRLPWGVRYLFRVALLVKCLPVDFGIDEALLGIGMLLMLTVYRPTWNAIRAEAKR